MECSRILFCTSEFPRARKRISSKFTELKNLASPGLGSKKTGAKSLPTTSKQYREEQWVALVFFSPIYFHEVHMDNFTFAFTTY